MVIPGGGKFVLLQLAKINNNDIMSLQAGNIQRR
jgi:hypothetical protein